MMTQEHAEIVPAQAHELGLIRDLATSIWNTYYPAIIGQQQIDYMLSIDYSLEKLQQDLDDGVQIDKLVLDGTLIGFAAYGPTAEPRVIKLHKIYIEPTVHGKGLGSLLLIHIEKYCRENQYRKLVLQVNKGNLRAIQAYERNDFIKEKAVVVDIGEGFVMDDFIMSKEIN